MKTANDVIALTNEYLTGHQRMEARRKQWYETIGPLIKNTLEELCMQISEKNELFTRNMSVQNEFLVPGFYIQSGAIPMPKDDPGYQLDESGFEIHFILTSSGRIRIEANRHCLCSSGEGEVLEVIDEPRMLTKELIIDLVYRGIERTIKTSFLFEGD